MTTSQDLLKVSLIGVQGKVGKRALMVVLLFY